MKVRHSVLFFLVIVLVVVARDAPAVDAWVLWVEEERFSDPRGTDWGAYTRDWRVLDASSSETECRRKLGETIKRVSNSDNSPTDEDVMYKVTGNTVTFMFFPKNAKPNDKVRRTQVLHYVCLPDTVDPREPRVRK